MTERNIYADNYSCSFSDPSEFLDFLKERQDNSRWMVTPSRSIVFESLEKDTPMGDLYLKLYEHEGRAEIIADTMENTNLLLKVNGETYPVRSCAIKTILERTPPELGVDIIANGIYLTGGSARIRNLDLLLQKKTGISVKVDEDPEMCVVRGLARVINEKEFRPLAFVTKEQKYV